MYLGRNDLLVYAQRSPAKARSRRFIAMMAVVLTALATVLMVMP